MHEPPDCLLHLLYDETKWALHVSIVNSPLAREEGTGLSTWSCLLGSGSFLLHRAARRFVKDLDRILISRKTHIFVLFETKRYLEFSATNR